MSKPYTPGVWCPADPDTQPTGECAVEWFEDGIVRYADGVCASPEAWRRFVVKGHDMRGKALLVLIREARPEWSPMPLEAK